MRRHCTPSRDDQVTDFATKVLWLLDHPEQRERMGQIGRKRVQEAFGWKYSVLHLLEAYDRGFSN